MIDMCKHCGSPHIRPERWELDTKVCICLECGKETAYLRSLPTAVAIEPDPTYDMDGWVLKVDRFEFYEWDGSGYELCVYPSPAGCSMRPHYIWNISEANHGTMARGTAATLIEALEGVSDKMNDICLHDPDYFKYYDEYNGFEED